MFNFGFGKIRLLQYSTYKYLIYGISVLVSINIANLVAKHATFFMRIKNKIVYIYRDKKLI